MVASRSSGRRVLVIAPHALDEALGCGGTLAWHARRGDIVDILVLFGDSARHEAATQAATDLGVAPPIFAGFPENRSDRISLADIIAVLEKTIRARMPEIAYVPWGGGLHLDHRTTFEAMATASRALPDMPISEIYLYEILSSSEWTMGTTHFRPTRFVDIAATFDAKHSAISRYTADLRPAPHARSLEAVQALSVIRGAQVGLAAAEGFEVMRQVIRADL